VGDGAPQGERQHDQSRQRIVEREGRERERPPQRTQPGRRGEATAQHLVGGGDDIA
jgi:hypothetical protein